MAVAFARVSAAWAEFTADLQTVTIPASTASGERMFLWVQWKDQGITLATPSGWNLIVNFSDGSTGTGNGTGSIRQSVFYRDWVNGDANPQLDFSTATGLLAEAAIINFTKGASDTWGTPIAVSAAINTWGTSATTTSASSTATVRSNAVVICGVGIRDDSATMTRGNTAIDDAGSLITWNGNYVESPATHYSTTTGDDHSGDLGYRLVTTGAAGVTLRATGTISATETGSLVWVIQPANDDQTATPSTLSLATSAFAPTVTATQNQLLTPSTLAVTTSTFAPTVTASDHKTATPTTASLTSTGFAPVIALGVIPSTAALTTATFVPTVSVTDHKTATPSTLALTTATFAPTVTATAHQTVTPTTLALALSTFAPTVTATENQAVTPSTAALTLSTYAPTVTATGGVPQVSPYASAVAHAHAAQAAQVLDEYDELLLFGEVL